MFGLNAGIAGTPGLSGFKSKGEALKYAIEFATQWKDSEKAINYPAAEELYNFICKHVELPETFDDGLSSFFQRVTETIEEEKRNKEKLEELKNLEEPDVAEKETQDKVNEAVDTVEGIVEGEGPVKEERSALWDLYECIEAHTKAMGLRPRKGTSGPGYTEKVFRLDGYGEYLDVTITFSTCPKKE